MNSEQNYNEKVEINMDNLNKSNLSCYRVQLRWKNITYSILKNSSEERKLLHNVGGRAKPGELVALMGPSGAGKSTLLNVLANKLEYKKNSKLYGSVKINGVDVRKIGSKKFASLVGYVQQDDLLFGHQTVKEVLMTAARFRLPKEMSYKQKKDKVNQIIKQLGLSKVLNTKIGDAMIRGVSGGERRRVTIGIELIQDPSLLFLDEPTSGLDSFQALNVIQTLKSLCNSGHTVVMTIHQPRSSIFNLIDHLILLADGKIIYDGVGGNEAVNYFTNIGYPCPELYNPADYFLDTASIDNRTEEEDIKSQQRIEHLINSFIKLTLNEKNIIREKNADDNKPIFKLQRTVSSIFSEQEHQQELLDNADIKSSRFEQLYVLSKRNFVLAIRNIQSIIIRLISNITIALLLCLVYNEVGNGQKSIQDREGALFFISMIQAFVSSADVINNFPSEKHIIKREREAKSYYLSSYYLSKVIIMTPFEILYSVIFGSIVYFIVGFQNDIKLFLTFLLILIALGITNVAYGFWIASMCKNSMNANALNPPIVILIYLFGGYLINLDSLPKWINWLGYVSYMKWSFAASCINEFKGRIFICDTNNTASCITNGDEVLNLLSLNNYNKWLCILYLFIEGIGFHILAYFILKFSTNKYKIMEPIPEDVKTQFTQEKINLLNSTDNHNTSDNECD